MPRTAVAVASSDSNRSSSAGAIRERMRLLPPSFAGYRSLAKLDEVDEVSHMMVDKTGMGSPRASKPGEESRSSENSAVSSQDEEADEGERMVGDDEKEVGPSAVSENSPVLADKSPGGTRTKSNQRWMKLRTTVQLSGAISNTIQKSKPPLKREDSFLKRFSTRQIPEAQETVDTGDETEPSGGVRMQDELNRRRRKRRKELSRTVVNPDENFFFYWLMTVTVCVLYNLWTLIVRQSFPELQRDSKYFWYACDGFTDVVFVCDIVVQFRTGYLEQGLMVYDSKKLAGHYVKSRAFVMDMLSLIPLDLLQIRIGINPILRFPRFLKIYRVYNYYYIVESRTVYPNLWRVINLIHILLILAHWFGCFYYLLSEAEGFKGAWVYPYGEGDDSTLARKYLGSLYWSTLTLTTIGDLPTPETNAESSGGRSKAMTSPEDGSRSPRRRGNKSRLLQINSSGGYIFTIVSYLIGVFIFATIVGQVGNVITNRNANRLEFERLLDGAKTYMRHHKVPGGMKRRVLRWYDYSWSRGRIQGGGDINTALGLLPDKLKTELALHVNLSVLKKVTIFQECQPEFLHDLVLKMKAYIFTPGDLICRKGEIAREMFIIADGILDVISENGRVLTTMKAGDFFGEIGILNLDGLNKRTADVRSVGYSELFSLSREDVLTAMKDYPEAQDILQSLGRKRLMEAKSASRVQKCHGKQGRDHESSGESDNAGKRIVEKLRSDVKGLKNALRRSRRGTRDGVDVDVFGDKYKIRERKQSILRRMSHVQSSDEYEIGNEAQTPIGVGLPLLQRIKLLKEKQDREREEKSRIAAKFAKKESNSGPDTCQRIESLKGTRISDEISPEKVSSCASTIRVQHKSETSTGSKSKSSSPGDSDVSKTEEEAQVVGTRKQTIKEKDKMSGERHCFETFKSSNPAVQDRDCSETSTKMTERKRESGTKVEAKEATERISEVPINKEKLEVSRKCSDERPNDEECFVRKYSKKGVYLSKSDTVLEKQKSDEIGLGKRSRSMSPSENPEGGRKTLKSAVELLIRQRRKRKTSSRTDRSEISVRRSDSPARSDRAKDMHRIKKYDSIDDLSPEYSGLPFVKKLKILNERQKLAELEKELVVRSASLDVPDRTFPSDSSLIRSQSIANAINAEMDRGVKRKSDAAKDGRETLLRIRPKRPEDGFRAAMVDMRQRFLTMGSNASLQSPESNETMERRHLKSILKKLSADDGNGDEDYRSRNARRRFSLRKGGHTDLKKLMRAPTVEGYAARHTKLTKSVTFDRESLQSPTEVAPVETPNADETVAQGLPPSSPTAILTLQLSNLSMIPIANAAKTEVMLDGDSKTEGPEAGNVRVFVSLLQEELRKLFLTETDGTFFPITEGEEDSEHNPMWPYEEVINGIKEVVRGHLDAVHLKLQSRFREFHTELEKREDIIRNLKSKIEELEREKRCDRVSGSGSPTWSGSANGPATGERNSGEAFRPETMVGSFGNADEDCFALAEPNESDTLLARDEEGIETGTFGISEKVLENSSRPYRSPSSRRPFRSGSDTPEAVEMNEILPFSKKKRDGKLHRMTSMRELPRNQKRGSDPNSSSESKEKNHRLKGSLLKRVTEFRRSLSHSNDFVSLEIEDSSDSSDAEDSHNKDWEIQMLVEEMSRNEKDEEESSGDEKHRMEEMRKLEDDVNTLKEVLFEGDLRCLSASELDLLEAILEAKDRRISEIASNSCFDVGSQKSFDSSGQRTDRFRCRIGQALSFDFHDIEKHKTRSVGFGKHSPLRKQTTLACCYRERQSVDNLLRTTSLLRNRVLEEAGRTLGRSTRSSLPLVVSQAAENFGIRTSLPALSRRDGMNRRKVSERVTSSVSFSEDARQEGEIEGSRDSVFDGTQFEMEKLVEVQSHAGAGSTIPSERSALDTHSSLNSFIRTVGQKMKQAVIGEVNALKDQVPTISKLCEDQSAHLEGQSEELQEGLEQESKSIDRFDSSAKNHPPDL